MSISLYFSKPLFAGDSKIRLQGSAFAYSSANVHRPLPGIGLGLFGDLLWIGFDYDQLRNGDTDQTRDLNYPRNFVVSDGWTVTVGIEPITAARSAVGTTK